jgi:transcriptional regulator with XRE-family HTH domain
MTKLNLNQALGVEVREMRTAGGLSQRQLAERASVHLNYIGEIERGRRNPTVSVIESICDVLETRPSELLACAERRCRHRR